MKGAWSDVRLNARRLGIVYGSLVAFAGDVQSRHDENIGMLETGICASSALLGAAVEVQVTPTAMVAITALGEVLVASVKS